MAPTAENTSILKDHQDRELALMGVNVRARLHKLLAEVEVVPSCVKP